MKRLISKTNMKEDCPHKPCIAYFVGYLHKPETAVKVGQVGSMYISESRCFPGIARRLSTFI